MYGCFWTIAGSDSGGGAGIRFTHFAFHCVHGTMNVHNGTKKYPGGDTG